MKERIKGLSDTLNKAKEVMSNNQLSKEEIKNNLEIKVKQVKKSVDSTVPKFSRFPLQLHLEEIKDENQQTPKNTREFLEQKSKPKSYRFKVKCVLPEDEKEDAKQKLSYMRWYFFKHLPKKIWLRIQALTALSDEKFVEILQQTKATFGSKLSQQDDNNKETKSNLLKLKKKKKEKFWAKMKKKYSPSNILANALGSIVKLLFKILWKSGILTFGLIVVAFGYIYQKSLYTSPDGTVYITGNTPYFEQNNLFSMQTVYTFIEILKDMISSFFELLIKLNLDFLANNTFLYILVGFVVFQFMLQGIKKARTQLIIVPILIMLTLVATTLL